MHCTAILLAAGSGKRMNSDVQKQFMILNKKPVIWYALECFQNSDIIDDVILVTSENMVDYCEKEIVDLYQFGKVRKIIAGGKERYDSVYQGLLNADADTDYVFIHDGARPFINEEMLRRGYECVKKYKACVAAVPSKDTVKIVKNNIVEETPARQNVWIVQTPQIFEYELIMRANRSAAEKGMEGITDDAMLIERETGTKVSVYMGDYTNIKLTTPEDLGIAETFAKNKKISK